MLGLTESFMEYHYARENIGEGDAEELGLGMVGEPIMVPNGQARS